jgi:hypothetical protein
MRPVAETDGHDFPGHIDEFVPCVTAMIAPRDFCGDLDKVHVPTSCDLVLLADARFIGESARPSVTRPGALPGRGYRTGRALFFFNHRS